MVSAIFALPGTGKSLLLGFLAYQAVHGKSLNKHGLHFCAQKKYDYVYTNFPAEGCYKLNFDLLGKADFSNSLILIDEIQLFADSRNFKNFSEDLKFFFSMHRHMKIDIIYASQSYDTCDKRIRSITDRLYYLDVWLFNCMRIRRIESFFDVKNNIQEGYRYSSGLNTTYFYRPKLYKYIDTYYMHEKKFDNRPLEKWGSISEIRAKKINDAIIDNKVSSL